MGRAGGRGIAPKSVGLPRHGPKLINAHNPWDYKKLPIEHRSRRNDLTRLRRSDPLPAPSPYWKLVEFDA